MPVTRRSSRIRAGSATPRKSTGSTSTRLASLEEQDDTAIDVSDNVPPTPLEPQTPTTGKLKPLHEEMHPSKAHQSTAKQPDSGLRFGFADISTTANQQTPSKSAVDSAFEFRFARPGPQLSADGQRMMDDLREEALRVKAKLIAERDEAAKVAQAEASAVASRKIAQAKGKVGRFSDVHMAEFRKMDSIADHPSSFRAQPGRITTPLKPALKRSQSQAKLQQREEIIEEQPRVPIASGRLENDAPAKRIRKVITDDISSSRPTSSSGIPSTPRHKTSTLLAISTPTQSSIARAVVSKPGSQIPSLARSSSKQDLAVPNEAPKTPILSRSPSKQRLLSTPQPVPQPNTTRLAIAPQSEPKAFIRSPGKVDKLRSMLHYPSASARKPSSIRTVDSSLRSDSKKPLLNKQLPALPTTSRAQDKPKLEKHVSFTSDTIKMEADMVPPSPSALKSSIPRSISRPGMFSKLSTPRQPVFQGAKLGEIKYPSLAGHPSLKDDTNDLQNVATNGVRPLPALPGPATNQSHPPPSVPGTFSFRSDHTIDFGKSPESFGSSPGQASVRQVRPSIFPAMPGAFPTANKENTAPIPSVPHGLSNKKRQRADSEDVDRDDIAERAYKKVKTDIRGGTGSRKPAIEAPAALPVPTTPSPAKKKGLSLSRLNMLARPKQRK